MDKGDDPYNILGVSKDASAADIKKAYRKLALLNHPDKQTTDEDRKRSHSTFAKISNAYEILSDEEQRRQYDLLQQCGINGFDSARSYDSPTQTDGPDKETYQRCYDPSSGNNYAQSTEQKSTPKHYTSTSRPRVWKTHTFTTEQVPIASPSHTHRRYARTCDSQPQTRETSKVSFGNLEPGKFYFSSSSTPSAGSSDFDDPFEVFKRVFQEEFAEDPFFMSCSKPSSTPITKKTTIKTMPVRPRSKSSMASSPTSPTSITSHSSSSFPSNDDKPIAVSTRTKTVRHCDGRTEVVTEKTIRRADGSVQKIVSSKSSLSSPGLVPMGGDVYEKPLPFTKSSVVRKVSVGERPRSRDAVPGFCRSKKQ